MRANFFVLLVLAGLLAGCGIIPKRVEFFQDKVGKFPEPRSSERELQRRVADLAKQKAEETAREALATGAEFSVLKPAAETEALTEAVSTSLGPPITPARRDADAFALATELKSDLAEFNKRLDDFKNDNDENTGKKIEGTGLFQIPYLVWLGIVGVIVFIGVVLAGVAWSMLKMYALSNPPVQLGVGAVQLGANFLKKSVGEIYKGGENFKKAIETEVNDPELQARLKELFRIEHERAQSSDVQDLVKSLKT